MTEEVIRYGAGGAPYRGRIGKHSTEADLTPPTSDESAEEEVKVELKVEEDDTPLTDEVVIKKAKGGKKK